MMEQLILPALLSAMLTLSGCNNAPLMAEKTVETAAVQTVRISGDASLIQLTTQDNQPLQAEMRAMPSGWLSGWFYNQCTAKGDMIVSGETLLIKAHNNDWHDLSDCTTHLRINLPRNVMVSIDQPAFKAEMNGQFADLNIETRAADISLSGTAHKVKIRGDALQTFLKFDEKAQPEIIDIAGRALDTTLHFPQGSAVSYRIHSRASLLDSRLPNTKGAKPEIVISGDYTRTVIK